MEGQLNSTFWYGFGQNFLQGFQVAKGSIGQIWRETLGRSSICLSQKNRKRLSG